MKNYAKSSSSSDFGCFVFGIAIVLSSFVIIPLSDHLTIYLFYGGDAYASGLRMINSKQGVLSDGTKIAAYANFFRIFFDFFCTAFVCFAIICFQKYRKRKSISHIVEEDNVSCLFKFIGIDSNGNEHVGMVEAESEDMAGEILKKNGVFPTMIESIKSKISGMQIYR